MATRKSEEDTRSKPAKPERAPERPGSYVQVVGKPRRRKSSKAQTPIIANDPSDHQVDRVGSGAAKYQIDRTSAAGVGNVEAAKRPDSLTKTSLGVGPDVVAEVQRALSQQPAAQPERAAAPEQPAPRAPLDSQTVRVDRMLSIPGQAPVQVGSPPASERPPESLRPHVEIAPPSQQPGPQAASERARSREEMASVFGARPSFRASDPGPAPRRGPSWGMAVGVALLSSIIAAAGVVALQDVMKSPAPAESAVTTPDSTDSPLQVNSVPAPRPEPAEAVTAALPQEAPTPEPPAAPATPPARAVEPPPSAATPSAQAPTADTPPAPEARKAAPPARLGARPGLRPVAAAQPSAQPPLPDAGAQDGRNRVLSDGFVELGSETTVPGSEGLPSNPYME